MMMELNLVLAYQVIMTVEEELAQDAI